MLFDLALKLTPTEFEIYSTLTSFLFFGHVCVCVEVCMYVIVLIKKIIIENTEKIQEKLIKVTHAFSV